MTRPKAYDPQQGYQYQILFRYSGIEWEHCDYAVDKVDKNYLLREYRMAPRDQGEYKAIPLPKKYHGVK